jgi:hypothetical protein
MKLGPAERALYLMLERGPMSPEQSALFPRELNALVASKVVRKRDDGGHELVTRSDYPRAIPRTELAIPVPVHESMATLTARVPAEFITLLDERANADRMTRSEALRAILGAALKPPSSDSRRPGSGTRRTA